MVGEKFLRPIYYEVGVGPNPDGKGGNTGDNSACYQGYDWDNARNPASGNLPLQDTDDATTDNDQKCFGSAHPAGFNVTNVDGSVQGLSFDIDPAVWNTTGTINDDK